MPKRWCTGCGQLFDADLTGTRRCPACQAAQAERDRARRARAAAGRPSATRRGYGTIYQRRRDALVTRAQAASRAGTPLPCGICGQPCLHTQALVAHHPGGSPAAEDPRTVPLVIAHAGCNSGHRP